MPPSLIPIPRPHEALREDVRERPELVIPTVGAESTALCTGGRVLGRNTRTGIADSGLCRRVACIASDAAAVRIQGLTDTSTYTVGDTVYRGTAVVTLVDGDVLRLVPDRPHQPCCDLSTEPEITYDYTVRIPPRTVHDPTAAANKECSQSTLANAPTCTDTPPRKRRRHQASHVSEVTLVDPLPSSRSTVSFKPVPNPAHEEFTCPCCLEIIVHATTLVPCGHTFCRACWVDGPTCHTCRAPCQGTVACRALDNAIESLVRQGAGFFTTGDVEYYRVRRGLTTPEHAATTSSRRRRRLGAESIADHPPIVYPLPPGDTSVGTTIQDAICID
jgi:hypothetical protein